MSVSRRIAAALARLVTRGRVILVDDTVDPYQRLQVRGLVGEVFDDVHRVQPFGLYSVPRAGAEVDLLEVGAARDHVIAVLVADEQHRPKGNPAGETGLHGEGYVAVRCAPSGDVTIEGPSGVRITVNAGGDVEIDGGSVTITGSTVTIGSATEIDGKDFLTHTHSAGSLVDGLSAPVSGVSGPVS